MRLSNWLLSALLCAAGTVCAVSPSTAEDASYSITIGANKFEPKILNVKAGVKIALTVKNASGASAEFESGELNREKVVAAGSSVVIYIGPLAPGRYPYYDDFNQSNQGEIVAK